MWNIVQKFILVLEYEINYYSVSCIQFASLYDQGQVVQKVDSAIHRINLYPVIIIGLTSPIQLLNNWDQTDQIYNLTIPSFPSVATV